MSQGSLSTCMWVRSFIRNRCGALYEPDDRYVNPLAFSWYLRACISSEIEIEVGIPTMTPYLDSEWIKIFLCLSIVIFCHDFRDFPMWNGFDIWNLINTTLIIFCTQHDPLLVEFANDICDNHSIKITMKCSNPATNVVTNIINLLQIF